MFGPYPFGGLVFGGAYTPALPPAPRPNPLPPERIIVPGLPQRGLAAYTLPTPRVVEIEYATISDAVIPRRNQPTEFAFILPTPRVVEIEYATIYNVRLSGRNQPTKFAFILPTPRVMGIETDYVISTTATAPAPDPYLRVTSDNEPRITLDGEFRVILP